MDDYDIYLLLRRLIDETRKRMKQYVQIKDGVTEEQYGTVFMLYLYEEIITLQHRLFKMMKDKLFEINEEISKYYDEDMTSNQ